ncbi:carbohydrate-binding module family 1 protein, partial [Tulasnella calospora MUT 4182]
CGGQGWTGATTCVAGWTCVYSNAWYSQCLQGTTTATTTTTSQTSTTTSKTSTTTTNVSPSQPIQTLVGDWLWIRAVAAPNFHKYLRSIASYAPGDAILGDYTTAAQFKIVSGQLQHYLPGGSVLYMQVETRPDSTVMKLKTSFAATPNTYGTFAWSGDALTWTVSGITRPNNAAWLACTDAAAGPDLYINLGNYMYQTPAGCADQTIHYYNGATAVPRI